jgi:serine/threonine-protein kinase
LRRGRTRRRAGGGDPGAPAFPRRLDGDLDAILLKALRKEPEKRYASVEEMAADLRRHLDGLPVTARRGSFLYRAGKLVRRHKVAAAVGALLVVFAFAATTQAILLARALDDANRERIGADATAGFLTDLFEHADPASRQGEELTTLELLAQGARRIREELAGQPAIEARLLDTLGRAYLNLERFSEADELLEEALDLRRQLYGPEHPEVAASLESLGRLRRDQGDYPTAEALLRQSLHMRRRTVGHQDPAVAESLDSLAVLLSLDSRFEEAWEALEEAEKILSPRETQPLQLADLLARKAALLHRQRSYGAAVPLYRQAAELYRRHLGPHHARLASTLNNLGLALHRLGRPADARPLIVQSLAIHRELYGPHHPIVATLTRNLAEVLVDVGELVGAEENLREVLAIHRATLGEAHPTVAGDLHALGTLLHRLDRLEESEAVFRQALELRRRLLSPGHERLGSTLVNLGSVLVDAGRPGEAEPVLREGLDIRRAKLPAGHPRIAVAQNVLGGCLTDLGRLHEAEELLTTSAPVLLASFGADSRLGQRSAERLRRLCRAQGAEEGCFERILPPS